MEEQYPLYPELSEEGKKEAQLIIDAFKEKLNKVADEVISEFYCNVAMYIESDAWTNFRNELIDGFKNYDNRKIQGEYDFKQIRQDIYREYRDEIIQDLNQDLVKENESLKKTIEFLQKIQRER
jgi:hypothetical protein